MSKHTTGPWVAEAWDVPEIMDFAVSETGLLTDYEIYPVKSKDDHRMPIATVQHPFNGKRTEANARLIAAAPELLAALKSLLSDCEKLGFEGRNTASIKESARAAIAKAGGKA